MWKSGPICASNVTCYRKAYNKWVYLRPWKSFQVSDYADKLYWMCDKSPPKNKPRAYYFCVDEVLSSQELVYRAFCDDFGPLNLGMTYKYCIELSKFINSTTYSAYKVYHYTSPQPEKRANSAYLMGVFQIMALGRSADEAWRPFANLDPFRQFRDASPGMSIFGCTLLDCFRGVEKAKRLGWFDLNTFNVQEYEHYEQLEFGDLNWIIPGKVLAFSCPSDNTYDIHGFLACQPEDYIRVFHSANVTAIVRLNLSSYDSIKFTRQGIRHYDLIFPDGSCPTDDVVRRFLAICESERGAVAVHCKAGLGRTGTMIACYAMARYGFNPEEIIPWVRICRPGSILGRQQSFLFDAHQKVLRWAESFSQGLQISASNLSVAQTTRMASIEEDSEQSKRLLEAKARNQMKNRDEEKLVSIPS